MRLPLTIKPWRCPNLPRPLLRIALECELIAALPAAPPMSSTISAHVYESARAKILAVSIFFPMRCPSVGCDTLKQAMP